MKQAVNSDIFIMDSFFNILNNGGGSNYHAHLSKFDRINTFALADSENKFNRQTGDVVGNDVQNLFNQGQGN